MEGLFDTISSIQGYLTIAMAVVIFILIILVIILFNSLSGLEKKYRKFMRGVNNKNIEELVLSYLDKVDEAKRIAEEAKNIYKQVDERLNGCIQHTSVIRYRAFDDVGSDLSFSIALLDDNKNGVVLTGIYGRNDSTTYAKPVDNGISRYDLSEEELHVLNEAMGKEVKK